MQHGLVQWVDFLADKQLPILQRTKKDVLALIGQSQLSITQYSAPIIYDAGFSAHVFRHVNTQRESTGKNPLTTMSNALSHLGQTAFQSVLKKTELLEGLKLTEKNYQGYMRVMGQACHGALQATQWAQQRNVVETEETQLAALLQNTIELMLWCYGGDAMPEIEELCYVNKQTYEQAANSILGCGMRELGAKLAAKWNLPEMVIDGLTSKQDNFTLACGVSLASELSRIVAINWYGKDAENMVERIAKYKGKTGSEGEIERRLHLIAVDVNDMLISKGYAAPAKLLFQLADDNYKYPQFILNSKDKNGVPEKIDAVEQKTPLIQTGKKQIKEGAANDSPKSREAILEKIKARKLAASQVEEKNTISKPSEKKQGVKLAADRSAKKPALLSKELEASVQEFKLMVTQAKPAHDLIEHAVKACLLCGVERSVFFVKIPGKDLLVSRYSAQVSGVDDVKDLKIPVNKPHAFKILLEKSRSLFLNESNFSKYWNTIPDTFKLAIGVKEFFAMSIFVNNHAMGLIYADKVRGKLTQAEFKQFQAVCRLLSKGILQSAHNKKK